MNPLLDRPIHKLSHAARKVAEGDFSIYLLIRHAPNDLDYIDVLYQEKLSDMMSRGEFEQAFSQAKNWMEEYPGSELLALNLAVSVNGGMLMYQAEETEERRESIRKWRRYWGFLVTTIIYWILWYHLRRRIKKWGLQPWNRCLRGLRGQGI